MLGAQLRRRMEDAVVAEAQYQALDAAKKSAVAQRCNVDTFQALVFAAHLRPMRGGGGLRIQGGVVGKPAAPRCFAADGSIVQAAAAQAPCVATAMASTSHAASKDTLRSGAHWMRAWRAAPAAADRLHLLVQATEAGVLGRMLRLELSSRLLEEILACLQLGKVQQEAAQAAANEVDGTEGQVRHATALAAASGAAPTFTPTLAAAVLQAATGASGFAVARAGLPLHSRLLLERLAAEHELALGTM